MNNISFKPVGIQPQKPTLQLVAAKIDTRTRVRRNKIKHKPTLQALNFLISRPLNMG